MPKVDKPTWERDSHWDWLILPGYSVKELTGKYLFFSTDTKLLKRIAEEECTQRGFFVAKVSLNPSGEDYVLCLYWFNDSRKKELAGRYRGKPVKYRYWKTDAATRRGEYSERFKESCLQEDDVDEDRPY